MADPRQELFESVAARLATMMEDGDANWTRPWSVVGSPRNPLSGSVYTGINNLQLTLEGWRREWEDPRWATFKQIKDAGGHVKKGEKSTPIIRVGTSTKEEAGKEKSFTFFKVFRVFNVAEQTEGVELPPLAEERHHTPLHEMDRWVAGTGIAHRIEGDRACYSPALDRVTMPPLSRFKEVEGFYATFFHELVHATGHKSRLDRFGDSVTSFGSEEYAWEELIAELGAAMLCQHHGLTMEPRADHARYLNAWIKRLKEKPKDLMSAAKQASAASAWLIDTQTEKEMEMAA